MKYIKVVSGNNNSVVDGIYYSSAPLYDAELSYLKKVCNVCLDDSRMKLITQVVFKRQLLESALEIEDYDKCFELYNDLCRLLEISTCHKTYCSCNNENCDNC